MKNRLTYKITTLALFVMLTIAACNPYKNLTKISAMDQIQYAYTVHYADLPSGIRLAYMDEGKGAETLVMIHGLGSYSQAWNCY